jgi:outer membrane lipoprotein SlyB
VRPAGKIDRRGSLTLSFDEIRIDERSQPLRASVVQALDSKASDDNARIGAGAVVGAIIGGLLGGGKGALLGVMVGGGGTIAATEGSDVDLPSGTILRIRVDQPIDILPPAPPPQ